MSEPEHISTILLRALREEKLQLSARQLKLSEEMSLESDPARVEYLRGEIQGLERAVLAIQNLIETKFNN